MKKAGKQPLGAKSLPVVIKVTIPFCMVSIILIIVLFMGAFQKGLAQQAVSAGDTQAPSIVTEADEAVETAEDVEIETETEKPPANEPEVVLVSEKISFIPCSVSGESVEKDLTLFIKDSDNSKITGVDFKIKLASPEDGDVLQGYLDKLEDLNQRIESVGEETEKQEAVYRKLKTAFRVELQDNYDRLAERKQRIIAEYAEALETLEGAVYTDEDQDGMIEIADIDAGDYSACFVPVGDYDAQQYVVGVNVKDQIEYKVVESIQDKTVSDTVAGDVEQTHANIKVESVREDTVTLEQSSQDVETAEYEEKAGFSITLIPEVPEEMTDSSASYTDISTENNEGSLSGNLSGTAGVESVISISSSLKLYAVAGAESARIVTSFANVTSVSLSASEELSQILMMEEAENGYRITVHTPSQVVETVTGELIYSGLDAAGNGISVSCFVEIVGADTVLTDTDGTPLYVSGAGGMVSATVGNYQPGNTYYTKVRDEVITYHGWQTIDGKQYYYDESGNPLTGVQVIAGVEYHFRSDGVLMTDGYGIDVSKWQGTIDWSKASTVISFAIVRCGFRGTSGKIAQDPTAAANAAGARANGVKVGFYFYSMAMTEAQAVEEASLAVSMAKANGGLDLPIYIDMEDSCQLALTTAQRDAIVLAFCKTVQNSGYSAGVYANKNWLTSYLTPSKYSGISIWCAQYNTTCTYTGTYDIWQYSCTGQIPGISGYVDLNKGYF